MDLSVRLRQHYRIECVRNGRVVWVEEFDNLVTTVGRNRYLDAALKTGQSTPAWYVFLKGSGTVLAADTMASHSGWSEDTTYSNATRPAWTAGTVANGSVDNSASPASFTMNGTTTIHGAGLVDNATRGGTTGTLLGANDFSASRSVMSGDTLNVTVACSLS